MREQYYIYMKSLLIFLTILISSFRSSTSQADADADTILGEGCWEFGNSTLLTDAYKYHLLTLQDSLSKSVNIHNGFYKTSIAGEVYGFIQCRADVNAANCAKCATNSINIARRDCPNGKAASIYARWCFLHYGDKDITWKELEDGLSMGTSNGVLDETYAIAKGETLVGELARNTSQEVSMYKVGVVDVGSAGKRYGMAECNRDLKRNDCGKCLDQLVTGLSSQLNKRGWESYSLGCRMWYNDFKFYSDIIQPPMSTSSGSTYRRLTNGMAVFSILVLLPFPFLYEMKKRF